MRFTRGLVELVTQNGTPLARQTREAKIIRPRGSGNISEECYSVSVSNVGGSDGVFLGERLKDGETLNFDAGSINNFFRAESITYDATDTEFIIIYIV
jgi:hypothetical protein